MLTIERERLIQESLRSLAASHAAAVAQIEQTMNLLAQALEPGDSSDAAPTATNRPQVDVATFSVLWKGRTCFLGNTLLFRLFARLARSPNTYVTHVDLLDDVWRGNREASTVRGVVRRLRAQLIMAGMPDVAAAIQGNVAGHYGLMRV